MRALLLLLLASCAEPEIQTWECTTSLTCEGQTFVQHFNVCASRDDVEHEEKGWNYVCEGETFVFGCSTWACGETCHPTGDTCATTDAGTR